MHQVITAFELSQHKILSLVTTPVKQFSKVLLCIIVASNVFGFSYFDNLASNFFEFIAWL